MSTAFVTGATGLLGGNLVRELAGRGWSVRALVRDEGRARRLLAGVPNLTLRRGDMEDGAEFAPALAGVDVVFHAAAYFRESAVPRCRHGKPPIGAGLRSRGVKTAAMVASTSPAPREPSQSASARPHSSGR